MTWSLGAGAWLFARRWVGEYGRLGRSISMHQGSIDSRSPDEGDHCLHSRFVMKKNRDDFSPSTKLKIAKRAGWLCSYPPCRTPTVGATSDGQGEINIGTAAHICAAASGGPRYDEKMSPEERASPNNGIWMCRDHGTAVDSKDPEFTVKRLHEWKRQAEQESWRRVLRNEESRGPTVAGATALAIRLHAAAKADLEVFQRSGKWASTSVALTLRVEGLNEPVPTSALARAVMSLDDLILVAAPGMGKTTTLFQIADGVAANDSGIPLLVHLGDWATQSSTILDSILKRPAYRGISEDDFRTGAAGSGVLLLLDGWNELDADARARARVQVATLKAELPALNLVVSTRRQALDVPFVGTRVDLTPLSDEQQIQIATAMRGEAGARLVDQAWRTPGVSELATIPLYLTTLLSLPGDEPFPMTKEEVLRSFVAAHEKDARRSEALHGAIGGFQHSYLENLALFATQMADTGIVDTAARRSISETETLLAASGQITSKHEPNDVLGVLVSNHVLVRAGDTPAYSFQHQQFQEWYASHPVERRIIAEIADPAAREALKAEILNLPAWEEAILFAVERLSRGDARQIAACGNAILAAFEVDPLLAAEMIFHSTEEVWVQIATTIQGLVARWHVRGEIDRALRFMLVSGRSEFVDFVWPLITSENEQISLAALRNCGRFRPSVLGKDAETKIRALPPKARVVLLDEIAMHGAMDGLELVTDIASDDHDPGIQASVVGALAFRRADRHVARVLKNAGDKTYDLIVRRGLVDHVIDEDVKSGLAAARRRQISEGISTSDRLRSIVYADGGPDCSAELAEIISTMETGRQRDAEVQLVYEARKRYPRAVAEALLTRLREGRELFYGADDILAAAGFALEDELLLGVALAETDRNDHRAEAAASVLGPQAVGSMIDALLGLQAQFWADGKYNRPVTDFYQVLQTRLAHTPGTSLVAAVHARSAQASNEQVACLATLLSRRPDGDSERGRPFGGDALVAIQALAEEWGDRMLASGDAKRWQLANIATLASHAPSVQLLPLLKRLLDDNLRRYRAFREEAAAQGWRQGDAVNEARTPCTHEYLHAFLAIDDPQTAALMREYLTDEHFGALAAQVLASQWLNANEPAPEKFSLGGADFSHVKEKRTARAANPDATSTEAETIFAVVDALIADGSTDDQKKLGVALGIIAARLPHGRRDRTIGNLIELAPRRARPALLRNLVLSGEEIDAKVVADGVVETFEAAKKETWILTQSEGYELKVWLDLLPFVSEPVEALAILRDLPSMQREPRFLHQTVTALPHAPSAEAEEVFFKLAEDDPRFYADHYWRRTALQFGTQSAAHRLVDLAAKGTLQGTATMEDWALARDLGTLIGEYPDLRRRMYELLKDGPTTGGLMLLARAVAECPDANGLLLLVGFQKIPNHSLVSWRTIETAVTEQVPAENWEGAYNVVPIPVVELRQKLLAMTTDGGRQDAAARCLNAIDKLRDEHGAPITEPRHPDLKSGKPWPIVAPQ